MKKHPIFSEKRWVVWNAEEVNGRKTKIPYSVHSARRASSVDESTWSTYAEAKRASEFFSGIGVIFTPAMTLLGIDLDHVLKEGKLDPSNPEHDRIEALIKNAKTYTEISPSGDGLHLYLALTGALKLEGNRHAPYEAYTAGRFFTFTENPFGRDRAIRTVSPEEATALLASIGYPWKEIASAPTAPSSPEREQAKRILEGSIFEDHEVLKRMFDSKNGAAIQELYDGDLSKYGDDASRADAALLSHLAFWTRKDGEQMERLWLESPLGSREKTQKREDYRKRSIAGAIAKCRDVFRTQEERIFDETGIDFLYTLNSRKEKQVTQNTENIARILRQHPDFNERLRFDDFTQVLEIRDSSLSTDPWRPFEDNDAVRLQSEISIRFEFFRKVGKDMVFDAIVLVAKENAYDSAISFVRSIPWDGVARIDTWLCNAYGVADNAYHRAVGSNWLKGLVKRIVVPGCKFDYVLVLEGEQGAKKSTSLHVLGRLPNGRSMHVETTMGVDSKDFFMQFQGKAIIEFSEGETLSRTEVKKMKAIITMQSDKYRAPYSRVSQDYPRRVVFAMTTNQDEYLKDETGNRRWLPVRVVKEEADIEWIEANHAQLFAEAYHRVIEKNETLYEFPKEETIAEQEARRVSDPNEERILDWYYGNDFGPKNRDEGITIQEVYVGAMGGTFSAMKKYEEMAIADVLRRVLKLKKVRRMVNGRQQMRWVPEHQTALDYVMAGIEGSEEIDPDDIPL